MQEKKQFAYVSHNEKASEKESFPIKYYVSRTNKKKIAEYKQYIFPLHMSTQLFLLNKYDIDNVSIIESSLN